MIKKNEKLYTIEIIKQTSFSTYFRDVKCFQISNTKAYVYTCNYNDMNDKNFFSTKIR